MTWRHDYIMDQIEKACQLIAALISSKKIEQKQKAQRHCWFCRVFSKTIVRRPSPQRLGYKLNAIFEQNERKPDGSIRDTCIYSRLDTKGLPKIEVSW